MSEIVLRKEDEQVMKLLNYFITKEGYNPVILHGAKDEIWLENLDKEYRIIRIVTNYIHNKEQLDFDLYRTNQILKRIKKKTFAFKMNSLNIFLNLGDSVDLDENYFNCVKMKDLKDLKKYDFVLEVFPNITKETKFKEKGMELFAKLTKDIEVTNQESMKQAKNVFKPVKPVITYTIIAINTILFLLMYILGKGSENPHTLLQFGANHRVLVQNGDYFRLITSAFLHIGIIHFLVNNYSLKIIGSQLEGYLGRGKYLAVYLISAVTGSLMSILFWDGISAGASGAIFGLLGSLLYFGYHYRIYLGNALKKQILPIIALNLMIGFTVSGIDNGAHIGGLIGGVIATMALGIKYKSKKQDIINGIIMGIIFIGFLIYMVFFN